jgi:predicted RNA-binding Zn-ribbon protein involved in translation (DUF1610 family)
MPRSQEEKKEEADLGRLLTVLTPLESFLDKHPSLTPIEFDYYTDHDLILFTVEPDFDFAKLKINSDKLLEALPASKRILAKPIINLIDSSDVLPVETVKIINQATMQHLASHSENVANITENGITPRKLLTRIYEDDYSIYENQVFCNFLDAELHYVRKNLRALKDFIYTSETLNFNLLERVNHLSYFLALGKLHTGYIRDFEKYFSLSQVLCKKLTLIYNGIVPRLKKPVYRNNKLRNKNLHLRKTNIFLMQKDYHEIYKTYKYFLNQKLEPEEQEETLVDTARVQKDYFYFVEALTIFALLHFNFGSNEEKKMDLKNLDSVFSYKKWNLEVKSLNNEGLLLTFSKEKTYVILLRPLAGKKEDSMIPDSLKGIQADETLICTPFEEDYLQREDEFLSVENIDSFRRLQQLFLKGMIYSDTERKDCPFCSGQLSYDKKRKSYECPDCRTLIREETCPETGKKYFVSEISAMKKNKILSIDFKKEDMWLYQRKVEGAMYYRNITKIDGSLQIICPHCGKIHAGN